MKCINCGNECNDFLCKNCLSEEILEVYINKIIKKDILNSNTNLKDFLENSTYEERCECLAKLLNYYEGRQKEYFVCMLLKMTNDSAFELSAIEYINKSNFCDLNTQYVLYNLLSFYFRNDYIKPLEWYKQILDQDNLSYELYYNAAEYFSMIGDYEASECLLNKIEAQIDTLVILYNCSKDFIIKKIERLRNLLERYRNGKPYWPQTEERRKQIADIYKLKGINYDNYLSAQLSVGKSKRVKESDFGEINECQDSNINTYCSFWCNYVENIKGIKAIYEIAAIKVIDGEIVSEFEKFIKPWDGRSFIESAAKLRKIDYEILNTSDSVLVVVKSFLDFVENHVLVSTGALGNQLKVLIRALRYNKISIIDNKFLDILDFAADVSEEFDMANNTRQFLLDKFNLTDEIDAKSKALNNIKLFNALKEWK